MNQPATGKGSVRRREFLTWSLTAAGAVTPAILRADGSRALGKVDFGDELEKAPVGSTRRRAPAHVSVGYLPDSEMIDGLDSLTHAVGGFVDHVGEPVDPRDPEGPTEVLRGHLVDPHRLYSGDPELNETGVRCTIHGLYVGHGDLWERLGPSAVYVHHTPFHETPHVAWADDGFSAGRPVSFEAHPTKGDGLVLSIDLHGDRVTAARGDGTGSQRLPFEDADFWDGQVFARFVASNERGALKLRRGLYVIAWTPLGARRYPAPHNCTLAVAEPQSEEPAGPLTCLEGRASEQFAYLLMSVEPSASRRGDQK